MKDRDSSKQEADHHAKNLPRTAWLMIILQAKNTTVGIVATCSRRGPDLEPSITAEKAYYTHGSLITQNCWWKYLLRPTTSKIAITHHHQLLLQETAWPTTLLATPHCGGSLCSLAPTHRSRYLPPQLGRQAKSKSRLQNHSAPSLSKASLQQIQPRPAG